MKKALLSLMLLSLGTGSIFASDEEKGGKIRSREEEKKEKKSKELASDLDAIIKKAESIIETAKTIEKPDSAKKEVRSAAHEIVKAAKRAKGRN